MCMMFYGRRVLLDQFATKGLATGTRWSVLHMNQLVHSPNAFGYRCCDGMSFDCKCSTFWQMRMRDRDKGWKL